MTCRERSTRGSTPRSARTAFRPWPSSCKAQHIYKTLTYRCETVTFYRRGEEGAIMPTVSVRYIVDDVDAAIAFYRDNLGFTEVMHPAPAFAMLSRGDLRLLLSSPGNG